MRSEAILLRSVDFAESDRIVHLLTPSSGRVTALAKGARRSFKRFPGTLDVFNHLQVQLERSRRQSMARLDAAVLVEPFVSLRKLPARYALASYLLELFDRMAPEGLARPDAQRLFGCALGSLHVIAGSSPDLRLRVLLELRALDALGLRPELAHCVRCGSEAQGRVGFHIADGGVLCGACNLRTERGIDVHLGTLRALDRALQLDLDRLDRLVLGGAAVAEAAQLVTRFLRFHVGIELRSEAFLGEILAAPPAGLAAPARMSDTRAPR